MDYYIIEYGDNAFYEKIGYSTNSNINYYYEKYHEKCIFYSTLFIVSTFVGICICNIIHPASKYRVIETSETSETNQQNNFV